jgi:dynactin 1
MTENLRVGQVVELATGQQGEIMFIGTTRFSDGEWIGVKLDEPTGKNDGSVRGDRYFDCAMGHGMFVRRNTMRVITEPAPPVARAPSAATARPVRSAPTGRPSSAFVLPPPPSVPETMMDRRRRTLNAASPSPAPRLLSRPPSAALMV